MKTKQLIVALCSILLLQTIGVAQSSWKSPDYKPDVYNKVMVLAKFSDDLVKRQIEDMTVKLLIEKGMVALPAYANIVEADLISEDTFVAKAESLEVDALIVYTITGNNTAYQNTPSVHMNVGIPVRLGIFGGFLGTNVPIAGGAKSVTIVNANAAFYNKSSRSMQWSHPLTGKLKNGPDKLSASFAKTTINALIKDQVFIQ